VQRTEHAKAISDRGRVADRPGRATVPWRHRV
jgi:hypothetical protein